jgi:hypothetical protein
MKAGFIVRLLGLVMLMAATNASAVFIFTANLTGSQETPPSGSAATAIATFVLNDAMNALTYDVTVLGLDPVRVAPNGVSSLAGNPGGLNDLTRMHIHRAPPAVAGGIVFGQIENPGVPATLNDLDDFTILTKTADTLHVTGAWDGTEGNGTTLGAELGNLFLGGLYLNVHSDVFPGGEIRGQILAVPEPATFALVAIAMLGLIGFGIRRKL